MTSESYFFSRLYEIRRDETTIREKFDSRLSLLARNHLKGNSPSEIKEQLDEQKRQRAEMLEHPYQRYLELKKEAETSAPQLVEAIIILADEIKREILKYK